MFERIVGVLKLDSKTFEDIEHDSAATTQAAIIVAVVALIAALGSGIGAAIGGGSFFSSFISTLIWTFIGWAMWSVVTFIVGTTLFKGTATVAEMLRVLGFAYAPQFLSIIPCVGWLIGLIWSLAAGFIAVRQGLDLDNLKAFFTIVIGFILVLIGNFLIASLFGGITSLFG